MVNKVGSMWRYIIPLIIGLAVLIIGMWFILHEYFTEDEIDWEICRESVLLRANLPDADLLLLKLDTKGAFPLKCKTEVVTIDDGKDADEVYKEVSDTAVSGWYMFGRGEFDFIHANFWKSDTVCMIFARIHFTDEALSEFSAAGVGQEGFIDYYRTERVENSAGTYNKYLPIYLGSDPVKAGSFVLDVKSVTFSPEMDNQNYLLVYVINKRSQFVTGELFVSNEWENSKAIVLTSADNLKPLGCDKYLTVPA